MCRWAILSFCLARSFPLPKAEADQCLKMKIAPLQASIWAEIPHMIESEGESGEEGILFFLQGQSSCCIFSLWFISLIRVLHSNISKSLQDIINSWKISMKGQQQMKSNNSYKYLWNVQYYTGQINLHALFMWAMEENMSLRLTLSFYTLKLTPKACQS